MSRDWKKDMEECEFFKPRTTSFLPEIGIYWLQQYKELQESYRKLHNLHQEQCARASEYYNENVAEKERADAAERHAVELAKQVLAVEGREKKLREAIEHCIKEYPLWDSKEIAATMMLNYMKNVLSILYPRRNNNDM